MRNHFYFLIVFILFLQFRDYFLVLLTVIANQRFKDLKLKYHTYKAN